MTKESLKDRLAKQLKQTDEQPQSERSSAAAPHTITPIPTVDAMHGTNTSITKKLNYLELDPERCRPWKYHNRSHNWFGREEQASLNESIRRDGQQQLGLVRIIENDPNYNHEIIYGLRRNEACKAEKIKFKARVLPADTSDQTCTQFMHVENEESHDVSDLEKARNYRLLLRDQVFAGQKELADSLKVDPTRISQLVKASELFDYEWLRDLIEPIMIDVSIRSATQIARALTDQKTLRNARNHAKQIKEQGKHVAAEELVTALLGKKKSKPKVKQVKTVLVKKGRKNLVELHSSDTGFLSLTVQPYERTQEEREELIKQIMDELDSRL